jgi:hypothetical protein
VVEYGIQKGRNKKMEQTVQVQTVQARLIEGFENNFYERNKKAIQATNNSGYFANDKKVSSAAGCLRAGYCSGYWDDNYDPSFGSGAARHLLNLPINNARTLCAHCQDGIFHFKLSNGARAFIYIAEEEDKDGKITQSVGFTVPNDETNPKTGKRYFDIPYTTKEYNPKRHYNFTNCKDETGSLPNMVATGKFIEMIPNEIKQKLGISVGKEQAANPSEQQYKKIVVDQVKNALDEWGLDSSYAEPAELVSRKSVKVDGEKRYKTVEIDEYEREI